jgi:arginase family enzyme
MSTESQSSPGTRTGPQAGREQTAHLRTGREAEERADVEEDRRRQRDLDDAEMGGEA